MSYEVLARKWRPQQFDQVVGQDHVTQTLRNAVGSDRIAHAYLFVGPRGTGKTSLARIFAKSLNCDEALTVTPCDKCDACREIMGGTNLDVLEIDGASNNSVDQIRELRETVRYAPTRGSFKIYIIDEVHMLSISAFNALLKTLEEPPEHVKFLFATTEPEKIPATILSRCQRFDLRRIPVPLIIERLQVIARAEKVTIDDDGLLAIARASEGGLRDAESALDQLISFRGTTITEEDVLSVFGLVSRAALESLADKVLRGDIRGVIGAVAELDEAGKDLQRAALELLAHFRNLLVCLHVEDDDTGLDLTGAQVTTLRSQASLSDTGRVLRVMEILSESEDRMRFALSRRTLLETALIRAARACSVVSLEEIVRQINALKASLGGGGTEPDGPSERKTASSRNGRSAARQIRREAPVAVAEAPDAAQFGRELARLREGWSDFVASVGKIALLAKGALVDARPSSVEADRVVIDFDPEFAEEIAEFDEGRNRKAVEHVLRSALQRDVRAEFRVGEWQSTAGGEAGRAPSGDGQEDAGQERRNVAKQAGGKTRQLVDDPASQRIMETFRGSIVDIRE